jgi:hypothetical protein
MNRRGFLGRTLVASFAIGGGPLPLGGRALARADAPDAGDEALRADWLRRWEKYLLAQSRDRSCDRETGEELGWLVSPFLNGYYYGYLATRDVRWIERLVDWTDACLKRAVMEPDGYPGWPKGDGGGGESREYDADSLLGEAMLLRPVVLAAARMIKDDALRPAYAAKGAAYLAFAERIFEKWDGRGCWRAVKAGGLWVVPSFGIDRQTRAWSSGYARRQTDGFSNPDNKENHIARWVLALGDVAAKPVYHERAADWFRLMKSRIQARGEGKYRVWNYWEPAGPWDYRPGGEPKHWVGVHPNGGYYAIDVEAMVDAFEHGVVFTAEDLAALVATNRGFMWNHQVEGAQFQRIDGGRPDSRWQNSPGVLWTALVPHDATLRKVFLANHRPDAWGGLAATGWYLSLPR